MKFKDQQNRIRKTIEKLKPFLPKDIGFIVYDKSQVPDTEIKELLYALLELKYNTNIEVVE